VLQKSEKFAKYVSIPTLTRPLCLGAIHKGHPHKIAKNWTLLPCPQWSFFAPNSADVRIWRTLLVRKMSALDNPPPPWLLTSFMDGPLWGTLALQNVNLCQECH